MGIHLQINILWPMGTLPINSVISLNSVFKVTHWPKEDYGKFYSGDSYIILNTYKDKESDEVQLNFMCYVLLCCVIVLTH